MEDYIWDEVFDIVTDLLREDIDKTEAINKLVKLCMSNVNEN